MSIHCNVLYFLILYQIYLKEIKRNLNLSQVCSKVKVGSLVDLEVIPASILYISYIDTTLINLWRYNGISGRAPPSICSLKNICQPGWDVAGRWRITKLGQQQTSHTYRVQDGPSASLQQRKWSCVTLSKLDSMYLLKYFWYVDSFIRFFSIKDENQKYL